MSPVLRRRCISAVRGSVRSSRSPECSTGSALNITVMSYQDSLEFGIVVDREQLDDPWPILDAMRVGLDELRDAAKVMQRKRLRSPFAGKPRPGRGQRHERTHSRRQQHGRLPADADEHRRASRAVPRRSGGGVPAAVGCDYSHHARRVRRSRPSPCRCAGRARRRARETRSPRCCGTRASTSSCTSRCPRWVRSSTR